LSGLEQQQSGAFLELTGGPGDFSSNYVYGDPKSQSLPTNYIDKDSKRNQRAPVGELSAEKTPSDSSLSLLVAFAQGPLLDSSASATETSGFSSSSSDISLGLTRSGTVARDAQSGVKHTFSSRKEFRDLWSEKKFPYNLAYGDVKGQKTPGSQFSFIASYAASFFPKFRDFTIMARKNYMDSIQAAKDAQASPAIGASKFDCAAAQAEWVASVRGQ